MHRFVVAALLIATSLGLPSCAAPTPAPVAPPAAAHPAPQTAAVSLPPAPSLDRIRLHALAFGAILNTMNDDTPEALGIALLAPNELDERKHVLESQWNVRSRTDLLARLDELQRGGHRRKYFELQEKMRLVPPEFLPVYLADGGQAPVLDDDTKMVEFTKPDAGEVNRRLVVLRYLEAPARVVSGRATFPIAAWDYARYINLCIWGYRVGYLSELEAWDRIQPMARLGQSRYHSWAEFAADYLRGRDFWSSATMRADGMFARAALLHLEKKGGLWEEIPWDESLGAGPVAEDLFIPPASYAVAIPPPAPAAAQPAPGAAPGRPDAAFESPREPANQAAIGAAVAELNELDRAIWRRTEKHNEAAAMFLDVTRFKSRSDLDRYRALVAEEIQIADAILRVRDGFWAQAVASWRTQGISDNEIKHRIAGLIRGSELKQQIGGIIYEGVALHNLHKSMLEVGSLVEANWQKWTPLDPQESAKQRPYRKARFTDTSVDSAYAAVISRPLQQLPREQALLPDPP